MRARSIVMALLALSAVALAGVCSFSALLFACIVPQPYEQEHVWLDVQPGLSIAGYEEDLDEDVRIEGQVALPLPDEYVIQRERYRVRISTPVQSDPVVTLSVQDRDGGLLVLEGDHLSRCHPNTPPGLHCFCLREARGTSLSFAVRDSTGISLGSESVTYRVGRYGTVWARDCL
jgi:hypothetical protein